MEGIFKKYQIKCYESVQRWLNADGIKREEYLRDVNDSCQVWMEEVHGLDDGLDKFKALAMLSRQKVDSSSHIIFFLIMQSFFELQLGNFRASYKSLSTVIEYAIKSLPNSSILIRECLHRIDSIVKGLSVGFTEIISRDYTEGVVWLHFR